MENVARKIEDALPETPAAPVRSWMDDDPHVSLSLAPDGRVNAVSAEKRARQAASPLRP